MTIAVMSMEPKLPAHLRISPLVAGLASWMLVLVAGWWFMSVSESRDISRLQIEGNFQRISAQEVERAVRERLGHGFVAVELENVKADVESLPWVARARVERMWPAGVRIRIWEREPFALWGENSVLDTEGRVFTPEAGEIPQKLPILSGSKSREREVMEVYQRLSAELAETSFALVGVALDARGEWTAQTRAGIGLRLGQALPDEKLELLRGPVTSALHERMSEVDYVDLRYTNGFAVGWKTKPESAEGERNG